MLLRSSFWPAKKGHSVCVKTTYHMRGGTKLPKGWGGVGNERGSISKRVLELVALLLK